MLRPPFNQSLKIIKPLLLILLCLPLLLSCAAGAENAAESPAVPVSEITLSESDLQVILGIPAELTAAVSPEDASNPKVEWSSSDEMVATAQNGKIKGIAAGKCDILCKALDESGVQAVCHVEVVTPVKSLAINEKQIVLLVGAAEELSVTALTYTVTPEDAFWQDVTWESSNEEIASVSPDGTVRGLAPGKVNIVASSTQPDSRAKAQAQVIVQQAVTGIELDQESVRVPVKKSVAVKAAVSPENAANKKLTWTSSDENIAKVSAQGAVQGVSAGEAVITATAADGSEVSVSCKVTVFVPVSRINLSEGQSFALPAGLTRSLSAEVLPEDATDPSLIWTSSDENIAVVDENGTVRGVAFGKAKITASAADGNGATAVTTVVVNQAVESVTLKNEELYLQTGKAAVIKSAVAPEDAGNKKLEWVSSDEAVATVTKEGKVTAVSAGKAVISAKATDGSGAEAACKVTVGKDPYDAEYQTGLDLMAEEKFYSARKAFEQSHMIDAEEKALKCVQTFPRTGELWHNKELVSSAMFLTFTVGISEKGWGQYIMVYTEANELAATLFIRENGKVTLKLPGGRYRIREASGKEWYGEKEFFGHEGYYEQMTFNEIEGDDYLTDLEEGYEWTISINVDTTQGTTVGSDDMDWDSWAGGTT